MASTPSSEPSPVQPRHTPGVHGLIEAIYREYDCRLDLDDEPHLLEPGPYFRARGGEFWILEREGRVVATVAVQLAGGEAELKSLYVHPGLRGQGWGETLTELVASYARSRGCGRMVLWSDTRFEAAHRLYRRLGFTQEGERELHDSNRSVEYGFWRSL